MPLPVDALACVPKASSSLNGHTHVLATRLYEFGIKPGSFKTALRSEFLAPFGNKKCAEVCVF